MSAIYYQQLFGEEAYQEIARMLPGPAKEQAAIQKVSLAIQESLFPKAKEFTALIDDREAKMAQLAKIGRSRARVEAKAIAQFERDGSFLSRHSQ